VSKRIYLAGPDVFLPNARDVGAAKAKLCADKNLIGCFPLDAALDLDGKSKAEQARLIFAACEAMMRSCDICLANCTPFRGVSMDSGTAYEIGFMRALGKPVYGYTSAKQPYAARARDARRFGAFPPASDRPDVEIEDFDHAENLMIAVAAESGGIPLVVVHETGDHALAAMLGFRKLLDLTARKQLN
jgi:nucleoside 2-deoxyribosyltransferase